MGFEPSLAPSPIHNTHENKAFLDTSEPADSVSNTAKSAIDGQAFTESNVSIDPVEAALAKALEGATAAGQWSTVAQLARELEERRKAHADVVSLATVRARKFGGAQ
jgi:hypothetical protein